jgi:hypothetical protein
MRTLCIEGVASHGGRESCVGVSWGRSEALTGGVWAGFLSRETSTSSGCRCFSDVRKATVLAAFLASRWWILRGRRSQARTTSSMRENREISWSLAGG